MPSHSVRNPVSLTQDVLRSVYAIMIETRNIAEFKGFS